MAKRLLSDKEISNILIKKAEKHEAKANVYRILSDVLDTGKLEIIDDETSLTTKQIVKKFTTIEFIIISILKTGDKPKTITELTTEYNKLEQEANYSSIALSSRLQYIMKEKKTIRIMKVEQNSVHDRFYYCLNEWFDNDVLLPEYLRKIDIQVRPEQPSQPKLKLWQ